ncbi:hypothetical protein ACWD3J_30475 [Streptomyces sp. NPDC002755]|uniref:hypothetical protein n=1 Tax=Streptomyces sp. NPDC002884 TaxID=3154544 RepID=UPI00331B4C41
MPVPSSDVHQMVCAYDPDNPSDNKGFGPVAVSFAMAEALSLFKVAGHMLRPPGDSPAELDSIACALLPSGQELLVRRIVARDALRRGNVLSQALIGAPGRFPAELGLGLAPEDWPLGEAVTEVRLGEPLHRVDYAELHRRALDGAARLRSVSRDPALTEPLHQLVTWMLSEPAQNLSVDASLLGDEPRAVLLGLVDILGPLIPGPWSLSTLESVEAGPYRLIVMPEWPRAGSPEYDRLRLFGQLPSDGPARATASQLVARYQEHGLEGLAHLSRQPQRWQRMQPVERVESLLGTLAVQPAEPFHLALPAGTGTASVAPAQSLVEAEAGAGSGESTTHTAPDRPDTVSPEAARVPDTPAEPRPPTPEFPPAPAEPPAPVSVPVETPVALSVPDSGTDPFGRHDLIEMLIEPQSRTDHQRMRLALENAVGGWSEQEIDAACRTVIGLRLGLQDPRRRMFRWGPMPPEEPMYFYDVLISGALHREKPARAWAEFLLAESPTPLPEPLMAVVRRMFEQLGCQSITVHPVFFRTLGEWAIPHALGLNPPDSPPPQQESGGGHHWSANPAPEPGPAHDLRLISKVFFFIYAPLAVLVIVAWRALS